MVSAVTGTVAGVLHGFFFAKIGVPAFAVTLAGLLFWNGLMLQILGDNDKNCSDKDEKRPRHFPSLSLRL